MGFKDHFSEQAGAYARYRPDYPDALFAYLASLTAAHERAWDCATGNGQAAHALVRHFARVVATDPSERQLAHAVPHPRITFRTEPAEATSLEAASVDLVTVAQALHWFDFDRFFAEVRRVLKPEGVLAVWGYQVIRVTPAVDAVIERYYREILGPYWPPERWYFEGGYRVPFPFPRLETPVFHLEDTWGPEEVIGYLGTWSGSLRFRKERGEDPLETIREDLMTAWGDAGRRRVWWPLHLHVARPGADGQ